jgi:mannose-1-phosphate guanylyltransferase
MAGGSGTRLWPMSQPGRPKQLLPLVGGRTLLDVASDRLEGLVPPERRYLCTAEALRSTIRREYPQFGERQILGEPEGRDTVNAVAFTAAVLERRDPEAVFAVLTSDHVIEPEDRFRAALETGYALVEDDPGRFVTFAITPTEAATGYGYVERGDAIAGFDGATVVERFVEKPDRATAEAFLAAGTFGWNSGMFVFHAGAFMAAMERHLPESHAAMRRIAAAWDGPEQQAVLDREYPELRKLSVDYGIMEPAAADPAITICAVAMDVRWADLGSWTSVAETLPADAGGNRANVRTHHLDARNVTVVGERPEELVSVIGRSDLVVVRSGRRTLICAPEDVQRVREVAEATDFARPPAGTEGSGGAGASGSGPGVAGP